MKLLIGLMSKNLFVGICYFSQREKRAARHEGQHNSLFQIIPLVFTLAMNIYIKVLLSNMASKRVGMSSFQAKFPILSFGKIIMEYNNLRVYVDCTSDTHSRGGQQSRVTALVTHSTLLNR